MDLFKKNMAKVADKPRGLWGGKMLKRMDQRHMELIRWGLAGTDLSKYTNVLDIGCGSGNSLAYMHEENDQAYYCGVDYARASVKMARKNNEDAIDAKEMRIIKGNVLKLPYRRKYFDLVVSVESFYYWQDHQKAMSEIARVMKKKGRLVIILEAHNDVPDAKKHDDMKEMLDMFIPGEEDLKELFTEAGFAVTVEKEGDWIKAVGIKR